MDLETIELGGLRSADLLITTDALSTTINSLADNVSANASAIESLSNTVGLAAATLEDALGEEVGE